MKIVDAGYEILDNLNGEEILKKIERVARVCYKSEDKITEGSAEKMVRALIKSNHMAMLEHYSFTVKFICDRGVSHEIVRHGGHIRCLRKHQSQIPAVQKHPHRCAECFPPALSG